MQPLMSLLSLHNITKRFDAVEAVTDVSLSIEQGEFFGLLGPSGCGKTTLLRLIAGLEQPDHGQVLLDGRDITSASPQRRNFGMVFQSYALFPHLNVFENVAFGLRARRLPSTEVRARVQRALTLVRLAAYEQRHPSELSGGEQQRVAIARAIVIEPPVLLCDEPLSNLDVQLREELRTELRELAARLNLTVLYVTHDQEEAFALCDRIGVMHDGCVLQIDEARTLYEHPQHAFVARFLGRNNLIRAVCLSDKDSCPTFMTVVGNHTLCISKAKAQAISAVDSSEIMLAIRPEHVRIIKPSQGRGGKNVLSARIKEIRFGGATTTLRLDASGLVLEALLLHENHLAVGDFCEVELPPAYCDFKRNRFCSML